MKSSPFEVLVIKRKIISFGKKKKVILLYGPLWFYQVAYLKEFGLGNEDVGRLLAFRLQLMGCSIEERRKPLVKYLYYLGISRDGMRRILTTKPMVFCFDLESNIVQKVWFFVLFYPFFF